MAQDPTDTRDIRAFEVPKESRQALERMRSAFDKDSTTRHWNYMLVCNIKEPPYIAKPSLASSLSNGNERLNRMHVQHVLMRGGYWSGIQGMINKGKTENLVLGGWWRNEDKEWNSKNFTIKTTKVEDIGKVFEAGKDAIAFNALLVFCQY